MSATETTVIASGEAIVAPAPGRFSATTAMARFLVISSASSRVRKSAEPPGGYPVTIFSGLEGKVCANAPAESTSAATSAAKRPAMECPPLYRSTCR